MDKTLTTIDFFTHQDRARARSRRLVVMYIIAVLVICAVIAGIAAFATSQIAATPKQPAEPLDIALAALLAAAVTGLIIGGGSLYRVAELRRGGGRVVASALGGIHIDPSTRDPDERRVLNVVEEMAIASGVPVPPVFIMPNERGINAFAAGYTTGDAVIGVTRGCVEGLTRDELQGVMAHEFSHILNGDMRLNIRLIGLLNGIVLLSLTGYLIMRFVPLGMGGRRSKDGGGAVIAVLMIGIVLIVVGSIGSLAARIIQAAVSRQREYLADAAAVQFTRNPSGIANALRRIGGAGSKAKVRHPRAREAGHMFFGEAISGESFFGSALASHPPLKERIGRIDPSWDGTMLAPLSPAPEPDAAKRPLSARERLERAMPGGAGGGVGVPGMGAAALLPLLALAGTASPAHIEHARALLAAIPQSLKDAAHDVYGARAVVYALLLDTRPQIRDAQFRRLDEHGDPAVVKLVRSLAPETAALARELRLPLLEMAFGALTHLSEAQHERFRANVRALVEVDNSINLYEWTLLRVLTHHLDERFGGSSPVATQYYSLAKLGEHVSALLSAFAYAGSKNAVQAAGAFALGAGVLKGVEVRLLPPAESTLQGLDESLRVLETVAARHKSQLLQACALIAAADQTVTAAEAELLRAVADSLGVPTPPLLPGQRLV
jgi:Zn-dependent protease with chaperone function